MHGHSRAYSYDDQGVGFSHNNNTTQSGSHTSNYSYTQQMYPEQNSGYYSSANNAHGDTEFDSYNEILANRLMIGPSDLRYGRSTTPAPPVAQRYGRDPRYYPSPGMMPSSSSNSGNTPLSAPYFSPQHYSSSQNSSSHNDRIPTPAEIAHAYNFPGSIPDHLSQSPSTYPTAGHHSRHRHTSTSPILSSTRTTTTRSSSHTPSASTTTTTERYPCEICGKTFSRSHDRKRHHETQHTNNPLLHRCRYCRKEFSRCALFNSLSCQDIEQLIHRADSLKRHLDNGCDEMPSGTNK